MKRNYTTRDQYTMHTLTPEAAAEMAQKMAEQIGPRDANIYGSSGSLTIDVQRAFAIGATIHMRVSWAGERTEHDDFTATKHDVKVEVNWSGTNRTPAQAAASAQLYAEMANLAATIQSRMDELDIVSIYENKPKAAATK